MKQKKFLKKTRNGPQWLIILLLAVVAFFYQNIYDDRDTAHPVSGLAEAHFIDVGQGDAILIKTDGACILVDGGDRGTQDRLVDYLEKQGIHTLDLVVGTHPHSDHIGGLAAVINNFAVKKIMMPKADTTTETFRKLLLAIEDNSLKIAAPVSGDTFETGPLQCTVLAPNGNNYTNLNNASIVMKVNFGKISFLLTGDAEDVSENEILLEGYDVSAQVLKAGHHGSNSSTGQEFLDAVDPLTAIISCKDGNDYGHPHKEVLERLDAKNIEILRTDQLGDIVLVTDGETVWIK